MSSRNQRLSKRAKETVASNIYKGLIVGQEKFSSKSSIDETKLTVSAFYSGIDDLEIEYLEIVECKHTNAHTELNTWILLSCVWQRLWRELD